VAGQPASKILGTVCSPVGPAPDHTSVLQCLRVGVRAEVAKAGGFSTSDAHFDGQRHIEAELLMCICRHAFITVVDWKERPEVPYIVDPLFKEQFELSKPSATYSAILRLLPQEFVGTAQRLIPLVQCMCAEMAASFESQGLALPPW